MLAANHMSNFDPWPLGIPFLPKRQLRFMAKAELFNPVLAPILRAGGAFKVRRGEGDVEAIAHRGRARARGRDRGHVPGGDAPEEGPAQEARGAPAHRRGADRARRPACRSCPPRSAGPTGSAGSGRCRWPTASRSTSRDLEGMDAKRAATIATERLMERDRRAEGDAVKPLLVDRRRLARPPRLPRAAEVDPACNAACVGFANMLTPPLGGRAAARGARRLGHATRCRPTGTRRSSAYQSGRVFDDVAARAARRCCRELVGALGFAAAKAAGYEADDFLGAAVASRRQRGGEALVATSDRDTFQLASERTTILQPVRGVSELARIGPAEVRERYGVEPAQVPDFIALRGDPSDKLPGARGVGPKKAADAAARVRLAGGRARGRPLRGGGGGSAPLPANRDA